MSLYPSLEDMKVDHIVRAQIAHETSNRSGLAPATINAAASPVYPSLGNYMGLELSDDVIALNMPEYQLQQVRPSNALSHLIAPISGNCNSIQKAIVTQAVRQVVLCKDKDGKVGLRLYAVNSGIFVCHVATGSPAALVGLRFGDQVLEINNVLVAGMSMDKCHELLKKAPTNGITMAIRDRPMERTITLHKDSMGHVGFQYKNGKINALVKDSSAARNGLLTDHQLLEINTINVAGMKDKDVAKVIDASPSIVNITIIPSYIYNHMISKMSTSLFKDQDRTPAV